MRQWLHRTQTLFQDRLFYLCKARVRGKIRRSEPNLWCIGQGRGEKCQSSSTSFWLSSLARCFDDEWVLASLMRRAVLYMVSTLQDAPKASSMGDGTRYYQNPPLRLVGTQLIVVIQFFHGPRFQHLLHRDIPAKEGFRRMNFRHW